MDTRPPEQQRYARPPIDFPAAQRTLAQHNLRLADLALAGRCHEAGLKAQLHEIENLKRTLRAIETKLAKITSILNANQTG